VHLWQFLLKLLLDERHRDVIAWTGRGLEFKLLDPDEVARMWGACKNRKKMNYEKLSRGLRYYYEKKVMKKTRGRRYIYRFV
ncbi:hypothetical protein HELRODRAFT_147374, partial [Helobdella robusta]|uniref:ETS domain-containing protein n=1 Tax=Helobdella robusta TaxID=6412 RepID=T1EJZ6_HELRO